MEFYHIPIGYIENMVIARCLNTLLKMYECDDFHHDSHGSPPRFWGVKVSEKDQYYSVYQSLIFYGLAERNKSNNERVVITRLGHSFYFANFSSIHSFLNGEESERDCR